MTKKLVLLFISLLVVGVMALTAGNGTGPGDGSGECIFIDENGDGINDNFRDHDGDGVPNHLDPDWVKPQDGTGNVAGTKKMNRIGNRNGNNGKASFNSFQNLNNSRDNFGTRIYDGTGIGEGNGQRKIGGRG